MYLVVCTDFVCNKRQSVVSWHFSSFLGFGLQFFFLFLPENWVTDFLDLADQFFIRDIIGDQILISDLQKKKDVKSKNGIHSLFPLVLITIND